MRPVPSTVSRRQPRTPVDRPLISPIVTNRDDVGYFSLAPIANSLECASALGLMRVRPAEGCLVGYLGQRLEHHRQCECGISNFCTSSLLLVSVNRILRPYIMFFAPSHSHSSSSTHSLPPFPLPQRTCSMSISSPPFASCSNPSFCYSWCRSSRFFVLRPLRTFSFLSTFAVL
jgi:hypothetical protein